MTQIPTQQIMFQLSCVLAALPRLYNRSWLYFYDSDMNFLLLYLNCPPKSLNMMHPVAIAEPLRDEI